MKMKVYPPSNIPWTSQFLGLFLFATRNSYAQSVAATTASAIVSATAPPHSSTASGSAIFTATTSNVPVVVSSASSAATPLPLSASFPPVGSVPRDFSPQGLENIWKIVGGAIQSPPITTTVVPSLPIAQPSPPPPLYPSWFAPEPKDIMPTLKLPKGFKFGVATAAFQVEGAAKSEGKGPSMWDWNSRQPGGVIDGTTGDVVDLQYFLYKEDVARVAATSVAAAGIILAATIVANPD